MGVSVPKISGNSTFGGFWGYPPRTPDFTLFWGYPKNPIFYEFGSRPRKPTRHLILDRSVSPGQRSDSTSTLIEHYNDLDDYKYYKLRNILAGPPTGQLLIYHIKTAGCRVGFLIRPCPRGDPRDHPQKPPNPSISKTDFLRF